MSETKQTKLQDLPDRLNLSKEEEATLAFWKEIDAFQTSLKKSEGRPTYNFYDGPPFATGLPHYGHLLAGTIKDVVCRFAHQTGHHVERRFGWDCHGLPIEVEIEKQEGISGSKAVAEFGLANYNNKCREIVMRYAKEWEITVNRAGRWIDFQRDYKTMHLSYMESVWWVFSELFKKGLVYRGFKVMPYSTGCTTPLSNFECNMNYKEVSDPSLVITFPLVEDENTQLLAWTTTPWTLPSNLACVVHPTMEYVKLLDKATGRHYILAECRISEVYKKADDYQVLEKFPGETLRGKQYKPLFNYFEKYANEPHGKAFRVLVDTYVTSDSGTGVVHSAPGFGEDDYRVCKEANVLPEGVIVCPVDENGCYYPEVADYVGRYVKECDNDIAARLKKEGRLISKGAIVHSYPFCWRSETPLIYKAVEAWFVRVEAIKEKLMENNKKTTWVPEFVQTKRFSNWLEDARDWNVSRNRYWGTPLPLWVSEDFEEMVCVGSVEELEKLSGQTGIKDLHREFVDEITIPSKREGKPPLKRVPQVFDCWFESGSMPYGQKHYPFENKEDFEKNFPADFIAEGLDQTRGWFYTLMVLGTALFDSPPFKNLVVNGLVLAEDGQKMSKSKKNYPDPTLLINEYGADPLRLYLINSPVVRAEPLKFREKGVKEVVNDVFMPLMNTTKFFVSQCNRFLEAGGKIDLDARSTNDTDRWIEAAAQTLVQYVKKEMAAYKLYNVVPGVLKFIDTLSGWYVRMNRRRIKGASGDLEDWGAALNTLFHVLYVSVRVLAPFAPFFSEFIYQRLRPLLGENAEESVHYVMIPEVDTSRFDDDMEAGMNHLIDCVELIRVLRDRVKLPVKLPVKEVVIIHPDPKYIETLKPLSHYIQSEVNTLAIQFTCEEGEYVTSKLEPNMAALGQRFKGDTDKKAAKGEKVKELSKEEKEAKDAARKKQKAEQTALINAVKGLTPEQQKQFVAEGGMTLAGHKLTMDDVKIVRSFKDGIEHYATNTGGDALVLMDTRKDDAQIDAWRAREFVSRIQMLRKDAKLQISDEVHIWYNSSDKEVLASIERAKDQVNETIKAQWCLLSEKPPAATPFAATNEEDDAEKAKKFPITIKFTKP